MSRNFHNTGIDDNTMPPLPLVTGNHDIESYEGVEEGQREPSTTSEESNTISGLTQHVALSTFSVLQQITC
jgi:hypothetical protein